MSPCRALCAVFEVVELPVTAGADVAWAHALPCCGTEADLAEHPGRRLRVTPGLRRGGGRWRVAHEHTRSRCGDSGRLPPRPPGGSRGAGRGGQPPAFSFSYRSVIVATACICWAA